MSIPSSDSTPRTEPAQRAEAGPLRRLEVQPHHREALALLLQAHDYALELDHDVWDFSVEISVLRAAKLTNSDLRWLAAKGFIEHALETTGPDDPVRQFRRTALLTFSDATCAVLTEIGVTVAREVCAADAVASSAKPPVALQIAPFEEPPTRPKWDQQRRQLRIGAELVKEFKLPSPNQETVLMAFEEEGWPPRIDDPLPPVAQLDPRRRLHDTIKALNRKQKHYLIRFRGDGSGEGIRWEPVAGALPGQPANFLPR